MNNAEPNLLSAAWRYRWLVVVVTALAIAIGMVYQLLRPQEDVYAAEATMLIQEPIAADASSVSQTPSSQFLGSQIEIMRSPVVAAVAVQLAGERGFLVSADELGDATTIIGSDDSPLVGIVAEGPSPEIAIAYVNAVADGYREVSRTQLVATTTARLERIQAEFDQIDLRLSEIEEEINALISEDTALSSLRTQADAAVLEIAELQDDLTRASGEEAAAIRQEIQDYRQVITVYSEVRQSTVNSDQRLLAQEQSNLLDRRASLQSLQDEISVEADLAPDAVALVQRPETARAIGGLGLGRILAVSLILGLAAGVGLAYFLTVWRRSFTGRTEPEEVLGVRLLADIPDFELEGLDSVVPVRDHPRSAAAEAFRFAAASTEAGLRTRGLTSVFIVSSTLGHGKTTTVVNMSVASAIHGRSVLVVDCDFGNQETSRLLAGPSHSLLAGVTDVIEGVSSVADATHRVEFGDGLSLSLMPRGTRPSLAATTLQSAAARDFFAEVSGQYDLVLIDGPPMLQVAYASTLATLAHALVVVVEHQGSHSEAVELNDRLELIGTPVLGYVYNRSPLRREMTMSEGSMMDILGDSGFIEDATPAVRRKRSG